MQCTANTNKNSNIRDERIYLMSIKSRKLHCFSWISLSVRKASWQASEWTRTVPMTIEKYNKLSNKQAITYCNLYIPRRTTMLKCSSICVEQNGSEGRLPRTENGRMDENEEKVKNSNRWHRFCNLFNMTTSTWGRETGKAIYTPARSTRNSLANKRHLMCECMCVVQCTLLPLRAWGKYS